MVCCLLIVVLGAILLAAGIFAEAAKILLGGIFVCICGLLGIILLSIVHSRTEK